MIEYGTPGPDPIVEMAMGIKQLDNPVDEVLKECLDELRQPGQFGVSTVLRMFRGYEPSNFQAMRLVALQGNELTSHVVASNTANPKNVLMAVQGATTEFPQTPVHISHAFGFFGKKSLEGLFNSEQQTVAAMLVSRNQGRQTVDVYYPRSFTQLTPLSENNGNILGLSLAKAFLQRVPFGRGQFVELPKK